MKPLYKPEQHEAKIYSLWEKGGYFTPKPIRGKKPFVITLPPPNVTGELHLGHAMYVVEDILARYHRLLGKPTLWLPGFDHASIAVHSIIDRQLAEEGKTRHDIGREEFLKRAKTYADKSRQYIKNQLKSLGFSLDWTREAYTMDEIRSKAVTEAFVRLYQKGLIYRGERIINWCPGCQTAISDLENEYREEEGRLYFIRYPLATKGFITVATTRPETMLGDTAVAVHPEDKRYKSLAGKTAILPLMNRQIRILADRSVDPAMGTGAVKVTPAHSLEDFEIGQRHRLEGIAVIGPDAKMTAEAGQYAGMSLMKAREKIVADLKNRGLLEKVISHRHNVGHCQRCDSVTEQLISQQWFVKVEPLAKKAIAAVKQGKIKIVPQRFEKVYFHWLENIRDWCISRQLWWGHRIPVYYCQEKKNKKCQQKEGVFVSPRPPKKCANCGSTKFAQDPDILDTWFSSGLWPISTFGWPQKTADFGYFYPTTVRETGYDILFFWVAREVMMCQAMTGQAPYQTVYLHGLVRDQYGQKMSKTRGNILDPLDLTQKYGTDALRMALIVGNAPGNDLSLSEEKVRGYRNFANKVWNVARYTLSHQSPVTSHQSPVHPDDKWIVKELEKTAKKMTTSIENYRLSDAAESLYHFIWHSLADVYIEKTKKRRPESYPTLIFIVKSCLIMLHPFMPFVTESIWQESDKVFDKEPLIVSRWPGAIYGKKKGVAKKG